MGGGVIACRWDALLKTSATILVMGAGKGKARRGQAKALGLNSLKAQQENVARLEENADSSTPVVCYTTDKRGTKRWVNDEGEQHRLDGPAVEHPDGTNEWWVNNKLHRVGGPALEYASGSKEWYQDGEYHRDDGPARDLRNGHKEWYKHGRRHRVGGPAVEDVNGDREWYIDDKRHREDGPAVEYAEGDSEWYLRGKKTDRETVMKAARLMRVSEIELETPEKIIF